MTYKGVPPKDDDQRVRAANKNWEKTVVEPDGELRGPDLPDVFGIVWCRRTKEWWHTWRQQPQTKLMEDTDWETMLETALMHNELWRPRPDGKWLSPTAVVNYMAEIRRRVGAFGATWEDRQKLRLQIVKPESPEEAEARIKRDAEGAVSYVERLAKYAAGEES